MKIQTQPEVPCPRGCGLMEGRGECGAMDLYHCVACGKMEWLRYQSRRGSVRKKATDDPILVAAASGFINTCPGCNEENAYFASDPEICPCADDWVWNSEEDKYDVE